MRYYYYHLLNYEDKNDGGCELYIGRYGEDLLFTKHADGTYTFSCHVLELWDLHLDYFSKVQVLRSYCDKGVDDCFRGLGYHSKKSLRLSNLGRVMRDLYLEYISTKDEECLLLIKDIIINVDKFKLTKTEYIDCFITFGSDEHWDYIDYILELRKQVLKEVRYRWSVIATNEKEELDASYNVIANNAREAKSLIAEDAKNKHLNKFLIVNEGVIIPVWNIEFIINNRIENIEVDALTASGAENILKMNHPGAIIKAITLKQS